MKKLFLLIIASSLFFSGCITQENFSDKVDEISDESTSEDLNVFIDDYFHVYCDMRLLTNEFWSEYYGPIYTPMREEAHTDIPVMNRIGESMLNKVKIGNILNRIDELNISNLSSDFKESLRLLSLAYDFQHEYFDGASKLLSFDDFMDVLVHKELAFAETSKSIQESLIDDYEGLIDSNESIVTPESMIITIFEESCGEIVWQKIDEQKVLDRDYSIEHELIDNEALVDEPSPAFINVDAPDFSTWTPSSNNGAYYVFGETSNNCSTVFVTAENSDAGILDNYALESYEYGDVSFKYGIKKEFNNLGGGLNTYTFTAYCNDGQPVEDSFSATFTETEYNDSYNYNSSLSNDNYYTNVDGNSVHSPAYSSSVPSGASARCKDGTYSFSQNRSGTCSGHGGVSSWL